MTGPIHIVERITTQPGRAQEFIAALEREYLPLTTERGVTLVDILVSPPMHHPELVNEVTVLFTVPDVAAWWGMAKGARADSRGADFWKTHADLISHRDRSMAASHRLVEELSNV